MLNNRCTILLSLLPLSGLFYREFVFLLNNLTFSLKENLILMINVIPFQANLNSENIRLMSAMLCAALYPNVVQVYIHPHYRWNKKLKPAISIQLCQACNLYLTSHSCVLILCSRCELLRGITRWPAKERWRCSPRPTSSASWPRTTAASTCTRRPSTTRWDTGDKTSYPMASWRATSLVTLFCAPGSPLQQPLPGLPREGENEPRLHQRLQHGVRLPAGAVWRRAGQHGAAQGRVYYLPRWRMDPVCCLFSSGQG